MFDWFWTMFSLGAPNVRWTSTEIPHWWRINTQTWAVILIGRAAWEICFNQSEALSCDTSSIWNFCARSSDVIVTAKLVVASRYLGCFLKLRAGCRCSIQVSSFYSSWLSMKMIKSLDYEQSLFFLKSVEQNARHANGHARDWWREMGDGYEANAYFIGSG